MMQILEFIFNNTRHADWLVDNIYFKDLYNKEIILIQNYLKSKFQMSITICHFANKFHLYILETTPYLELNCISV